MKRSDNDDNRNLLQRLDLADDGQTPPRAQSAGAKPQDNDDRPNNYDGKRDNRPSDRQRPRGNDRSNTSLARREGTAVARTSRDGADRPGRNYPAERRNERSLEASGRGNGNRNPGNRNYYNGKKRGRKRRRKKSNAYKIGLIIFAAVLAIGVTISILILSSFLKTYEVNLAVNVVEKVISELTDGAYESMNITAYDDTPVSDEVAFAEAGYFSSYFQKQLTSGKVSYRKLNGESTDTKYVYAVKVDDKDFIKLTLEKQPEKAAFNISTWKMTGGQILDKSLVIKTIRIQAPQNAAVYVNGIEVDDSHMVSGNVVVEQLQNLVNTGYLAEGDAAYVKELSVEGLFGNGDTKVTLINADGTTEDCVLNGDLYSGGFKATEAFAVERVGRVTEMIYPWCYYFSGDGSFYSLSQYLWDYSPAYNTIQAADTSWMQEHSDIGIDNIVVDNFRVYSDTCFSCDVKFQENIYQWGTLARTWDSYMTWVYINGNSTFYMADYITHNVTEN